MLDENFKNSPLWSEKGIALSGLSLCCFITACGLELLQNPLQLVMSVLRVLLLSADSVSRHVLQQILSPWTRKFIFYLVLLPRQSTARWRVLRGRDHRVRSFCSVFQTRANGEIQGVAGTLIHPARLESSISSINHRMTAANGDDLLVGSIRVKQDVSSIMILALSIILPAWGTHRDLVWKPLTLQWISESLVGPVSVVPTSPSLPWSSICLWDPAYDSQGQNT